jgi:hypothetical protein
MEMNKEPKLETVLAAILFINLLIIELAVMG